MCLIVKVLLIIELISKNLLQVQIILTFAKHVRKAIRHPMIWKDTINHQFISRSSSLLIILMVKNIKTRWKTTPNSKIQRLLLQIVGIIMTKICQELIPFTIIKHFLAKRVENLIVNFIVSKITSKLCMKKQKFSLANCVMKVTQIIET